MTRDTNNVLINYGGTFKSLENGNLGVYAIMFGDEKKTDASKMKDFFVPETNYGLHITKSMPLLYQHGLDQQFNEDNGEEVGFAEYKHTDKVGLWYEVQLKMRKDYEERIRKMVEDGQLGASTGVASHRVKRIKMQNGSHKVIQWPLGPDLSLTPTPAEPRIFVQSLKSYIFEQKSMSDGLDEIKELMSEWIETIHYRKKYRDENGRKLSSNDIKAIEEFCVFFRDNAKSLSEYLPEISTDYLPDGTQKEEKGLNRSVIDQTAIAKLRLVFESNRQITDEIMKRF